MADKRLLFDDDLSDSEVDSQLGSNSEKGDDPEVTLTKASVHSGLDPQQVSKATKPIADFEFEDEPVVAVIESVDASHPNGGFLKEN